MLSIKKLLHVAAAMLCCVISLQARSQGLKVCGTRNHCMNMQSRTCLCFDGQSLREKKDDDRPIFEKNDRYGHYCYCCQQDFENFKKKMEKPDKPTKKRKNE